MLQVFVNRSLVITVAAARSLASVGTVHPEKNVHKNSKLIKNLILNLFNIWNKNLVIKILSQLFVLCSPGFLRFVNVLVNMNGEERKAFLQFTTGCSSLPPGGLANLYPRLTVVRKVDAGQGSYPSVNTCVHYLKLPDYPTEQLLRERLLTATREKGFHLN